MSMPHSKLRFIDTHAHLYHNKFIKDRAAMIDRAIEVGVDRMLMPNIDEESIAGMLEVEANRPGRCFSMMGLHPCSVTADVDQQLESLRPWFGKHQFYAVGEIGTDLYWDDTYIEEQKHAFRKQTAWAKELELPIVIHCRQTIDMTIDLVEQAHDNRLRGVFHCFTGTVEQANRIINLGFYLGIGGVSTFKNGGITEVVKKMPLDRLLLETDAPYLAPVPYRGKRNESAYIIEVAKRMAEVRDISLEEVAGQTTRNAEELFGLNER